jgi:hypothetical protein
MLKTFGVIQDLDFIVICSPAEDEFEDDEENLGVITSLTSVVKEYSLKLGKQV